MTFRMTEAEDARIRNDIDRAGRETDELLAGHADVLTEFHGRADAITMAVDALLAANKITAADIVVRGNRTTGYQLPDVVPDVVRNHVADHVRECADKKISRR